MKKYKQLNLEGDILFWEKEIYFYWYSPHPNHYLERGYERKDLGRLG